MAWQATGKTALRGLVGRGAKHETKEQAKKELKKGAQEKLSKQEGGKNEFWEISRGSPTWLFWISWAILLDLLGLLSLLILDDYLILDFVGLFTIGVYDWIKTGKLPVTKKLKKFLTRRAGARWILEMIPLVGSILPLWTLYTFRKAKKDPTNELN